MTKKPTKEVSPEKIKREGFETGFSSYGHSGGHYDSSDGGGHAKGYSAGSGLRSIAQGSADQAHSIVSSQHQAANQAAYVGRLLILSLGETKTYPFLCSKKYLGSTCVTSISHCSGSISR